MHKLYIYIYIFFFLLMNNLLGFFQLQKTLYKVPIFIHFLKLDPDPHLKSNWIWIEIRKKLMRIHSPA